MLSIPSRHYLRLTTARQGEQGYKCGHVTGLRRLGVTQKTEAEPPDSGFVAARRRADRWWWGMCRSSRRSSSRERT